MAQRQQARRRTAGRADPTTELALRLLQSTLMERLQFSQRAGLSTFQGRRNLAHALGYKDKIRPRDYRERYERSEVAQRVIEAFPIATWRGGAEVVEDDDPNIVTGFEEAALILNDRLNLWDVFRRSDELAGLGHYAVILIGAAGALETELPRMRSPEDIAYLQPFSEEDAVIKPEDLENDTTNPRAGLPNKYTLTRVISGADNKSRKVHWTRVIHVPDGLLDDRLLGRPRLRAVWNRLDDLDKVVGSGSEAFWQRVQPGLQLKIDKEVELDETAKTKLREEIDEWIHGMRRVARLRGASLEQVGDSLVENFSQQVDAIMSLISTGSKIPKRILMGSERGELASGQDQENWDQQVKDRRDQFASPVVVRQMIDRFIKYGALPTPKVAYEVRWPTVKSLNEKEIADVAKTWAGINNEAGEEVVTPDEIRDRVLGLPPKTEIDTSTLPPAEPAVQPDPAAQATARRQRQLSLRFLTKGRAKRRSADEALVARVTAAINGNGNGNGNGHIPASIESGWLRPTEDAVREVTQPLVDELREVRDSVESLTARQPQVTVNVPASRVVVKQPDVDIERNERGLMTGVRKRRTPKKRDTN